MLGAIEHLLTDFPYDGDSVGFLDPISKVGDGGFESIHLLVEISDLGDMVASAEDVMALFLPYARVICTRMAARVLATAVEDGELLTCHHLSRSSIHMTILTCGSAHSVRCSRRDGSNAVCNIVGDATSVRSIRSSDAWHGHSWYSGNGISDVNNSGIKRSSDGWCVYGRHGLHDVADVVHGLGKDSNDGPTECTRYGVKSAADGGPSSNRDGNGGI